jgi:hypothetical protein
VALKSLSELIEGDDRQRMFGSPAELHEALAGIELLASVPDCIRTLFDTARNLSLCTWYVYEFHQIAELTGFLALEAAPKARAKSECSPLADEKSFRKLMQHAVRVGWIAEERIAHRREIARARVEDRKALASIRRMDELGVDSLRVEDPTEDEIDAEARGYLHAISACRETGCFRGEVAQACVIEHRSARFDFIEASRETAAGPCRGTAARTEQAVASRHDRDSAPDVASPPKILAMRKRGSDR